MSAFQALKDISNNFSLELNRISSELFSVKVGETFENVITKKLKDLSFYSSKLKLLQAKTLALNPSISTIDENEDVIVNYSEAAAQKVTEQQIIKSLLKTHHTKTLLTTPDVSLDRDLQDRKEKIKNQLLKYRQQETELRHYDAILLEKEKELALVRLEWEKEMLELKEMRENVREAEETDTSGPVYIKLRALISKIELMRWLITKLALSRVSAYDWLSDPQNKLQALALTREQISIEDFST